MFRQPLVGIGRLDGWQVVKIFTERRELTIALSSSTGRGSDSLHVLSSLSL